MLALIVGLLLPPGYPLPDPSLPVSMRPALPLSTLQGATPVKVYRGSYWRQGEYQRVTFAYRLPPDPKREVQDIAVEKDFVPGMAANPGSQPRLVRDANGVRQSVTLIDLQGNEQYGWGPILGKGQFAMVTEMPAQYPAPSSWSARGLHADPPLPPHYPPPFHFLKSARLDNIVSDPFVSAIPRATFNVQVVLVSGQLFSQVQKEAIDELRPKGWDCNDGKAICSLRLRSADFGLVAMGIEEARDQAQPQVKTIIRLSYAYRDSMHSPRIE